MLTKIFRDYQHAHPHLVLSNLACVLFLILLILSCLFFIDAPLYAFLKSTNMAENLGISMLDRGLPWIFSEKSLYLIVTTCGVLVLAHGFRLYNSRGFLLLGYLALTAYFVVSAKNFLKFIFGRCVPKTCQLLFSGEWCTSAQFHLWHGGGAYGSFPSGHCVVLSFCLTWMSLFFPRLVSVFISLQIIVIVMLICSGYHYLGDCLAGVILGDLFGYLVCQGWAKHNRITITNY